MTNRQITSTPESSNLEALIDEALQLPAITPDEDTAELLNPTVGLFDTSVGRILKRLDGHPGSSTGDLMGFATLRVIAIDEEGVSGPSRVCRTCAATNTSEQRFLARIANDSAYAYAPANGVHISTETRGFTLFLDVDDTTAIKAMRLLGRLGDNLRDHGRRIGLPHLSTQVAYKVDRFRLD